MMDSRSKLIPYPLRLRRPGAAAGDTVRQSFFIRLGDGWGEAATGPGRGEPAGETGRALEEILTILDNDEGMTDPAEVAAWLKARYPMTPAARAGVEMAALDRAARAKGHPLYQYLRLPSPDGAAIPYRLRLGNEAELEMKLEEARAFSCLRVQCSGGAERDLKLIQWIARRTDQPLQIDAGGAWSPDEARAAAAAMGRLRVEFIIQPLARHRLEETGQFVRQSRVPVLLREDAGSAADLARIAPACNGFVVGLMTCGGVAEALRMMREGRRLGLRVMLETGLESSLATTAAAHLAGAVDAADLGAPVMLENDPFEGFALSAEGCVVMPKGNGIGARVREEMRNLISGRI